VIALNKGVFALEIFIYYIFIAEDQSCPGGGTPVELLKKESTDGEIASD